MSCEMLIFKIMLGKAGASGNRDHATYNAEVSIDALSPSSDIHVRQMLSE